MRQQAFEQAHAAEWQAFEAQLGRAGKRAPEAASLEAFPERYRRLCHHLALAQLHDGAFAKLLFDLRQRSGQGFGFVAVGIVGGGRGAGGAADGAGARKRCGRAVSS